jgi:hypothetical protein
MGSGLGSSADSYRRLRQPDQSYAASAERKGEERQLFRRPYFRRLSLRAIGSILVPSTQGVGGSGKSLACRADIVATKQFVRMLRIFWIPIEFTGYGDGGSSALVATAFK